MKIYVKLIRALLFSFFTFIYSTAFSQSDFRKGYIINLENDTIEGEIDYRINNKVFQTCRFKEGESVIEYFPIEIIGYGFHNDSYFSSRIIEKSFVEVLVDGDLSLYRYKFVFYVKKLDDELQKMEIVENEIQVNEKKRLSKDNRWIGILRYYTSDCFFSQSKYLSISYSEKSLTNLVVAYNECKESKMIVYKENKPWTKFQYGLIGGLTLSSIIKSNENFQLRHLAKNYYSLNPTVGFVFCISFPRLIEKIAIQSELYFLKADFNSFVKYNDTNITGYYDVRFNFTSLSIPLSIKFTQPKNKYIIDINTGINFNFILNSQTNLISEEVYDHIVYTSETTAFEIRKQQLGFFVSSGISRPFRYFNAGLRAQYSHISMFSATNGLDLKNNQFTFSIILSKK